MKWPEVKPVIDNKIRGYCTLRYPNHPKGCPNFNKKSYCPPAAPLLKNMFDLSKPVYIIYNKFNFRAHYDKMQGRHPDWTDRQLRNVLYWQGTARKHLREKIADFLRDNPKLFVTMCPEACGVDVTKTMEQAGVTLEWPPMRYAYQVALAGTPRRGKWRKSRSN